MDKVKKAYDELIMDQIEEVSTSDGWDDKETKVKELATLMEQRAKADEVRNKKWTEYAKIAADIALSIITLGVWNRTQKQHRAWEEKGFQIRSKACPKLDIVKWFRH